MEKIYTTIPEVLELVQQRKPMCRETLYTHLRALRIKPLGEVPQRPQLYPADTAAQILKRLGIQ